jgi:L-alanine-DL-glutamate epimerase-like enolase superfamily enzyme
VDLACYDLVGKQTQQPVYQLLGGRKLDALKLNWTVASPDMEVVERQLIEGEGRGFCSFNIKVGYPQTPEYDLQLVRRVKEYAPGGFLWADANTGYDLETALEMAPRLADEGVQVLESPLPPTQIRGYQRLKRQGALPITMDEGIVSPAEAAEFIALEMIDGITMKPARCAGLWPSMQIIRLLQEREMLILGSGLTDPDLSLAGAVHLYAWAGITHPCALNGPQFLADTLVENDFLPDGDLIYVPEGFGLGLNLDPRAEAALTLAARLS